VAVAVAAVGSAAVPVGRRVPDQPSGPQGRERARRRPLIIGAIVIVVVLVAGGATAWAVSSSGNSGYRMGTVTRATIDQTQDVIGTVEPVDNASASFQVAGQVATVTATVGQQVTAGETVATLDTTSLAEAVSSAQSTVASDEAQLATDEDSETSTSSASSASTTTTTTAPASTSTGTGKSGSSGSGSSQITQDQASVVTDQATSSSDQQQEAADLSEAETTCGVTGTGTGPSPTGSSPGGSSSPTTTTTTPTTTTTTTPSTGTQESGCASALERVSADQQAVATAQNAVAAAESTLAKALADEEATSATTPTTGTTGSTGSTGTTGSTGSGSTGSTGSKEDGLGSGGSGDSSPSDSAATIASDEAAIDTAQAEVVNTQQSLSDAQLVSPIAGTVASVGISVGATVSANSSSDTIVIIGTQAFEATATLTSSQVTSVKVGDTANVLVDGATKSIAGTVSQVGPVQSSDGTYSYPLVVSLPTSATGLFTGSTSTISVITNAAKNVLAVPTSAITTNGTQHYVLVLSGGNLTEKAVKVGLVGYAYTQVTSGLNEGDSLVLADYSEAVPTSNTATVGGFGGTGGFGGAGGFGGGGGRFTSGGATTFGG
jgi:multidrug efflux pump subunit AcrA (membrane-fusion protein)